MSGKFHFELVSPEQKLFSSEVGYVSIPGEMGDMGIMAGHSSLLSSLRMGVISIRTEGLNDNVAKRFFVAGGFADIGQAHCTVLAESATDLSLVDVTALDAEIATLKAAGDDVKLAIATAKREAIG